MDEFVLETPEYEEAMAAFIDEAIQASMRDMDPIYASLRRSTLPEGVRNIQVQVDEAANDSPEVHLTEIVGIDPDDIIAGNIEQFHDAIAAIASAYLDQFMRPFFEHVGDAAASVGNAVKITGQFGWNEILDCYERVEWGVDRTGAVRPPQMTAGPNVVSALAKAPDRTPEQDERLRVIWNRKQTEHDARRRSRRIRSEPDRT